MKADPQASTILCDEQAYRLTISRAVRQNREGRMHRMTRTPNWPLTLPRDAALAWAAPCLGAQDGPEARISTASHVLSARAQNPNDTAAWPYSGSPDNIETKRKAALKACVS